MNTRIGNLLLWSAALGATATTAATPEQIVVTGLRTEHSVLDSPAAIAATEEQVRAAETAFEGVRQEAEVGSRTTLDVLDAEQEALDAEAARISAQANLYIAAYRVLQSTGRLTVKDLGLPVPQYDPAAYYDLVKDAPTANSRQGQQLDKVLRALQKE